MPVPPRTDHPRPHHYKFAHRSLPWLVHHHGIEILEAAATRDPTLLLVSLWNDVGAQIPEDQRLDSTGLLAVYRPAVPPMIVVTMPPATNMVEAHLAAIVRTGDGPRYLVLEESWSPAGRPATVLAEWGPDGNHVNYGEGPAPDNEDFVRAVLSLIEGPRA